MLRIPVNSSNCGTLAPRESINTATSAATTMNKALNILFAAIMRERWDGSLRVCIWAYKGTI